MKTQILWHRLDLPGHEICAMRSSADGWRLTGTALLAHGGHPCRLNYLIECDERWQTRSVLIDGEIAQRPLSLEVKRSAANEWYANGASVPAVNGCIDVDLGFSPSTNVLPIRRLSLKIGQRAPVRAAWVRFPELTVELLEQAYTRLDENHYLYESAGGAFRRELMVSADGLVLEYPDYWRVIAQDIGAVAEG